MVEIIVGGWVVSFLRQCRCYAVKTYSTYWPHVLTNE